MDHACAVYLLYHDNQLQEYHEPSLFVNKSLLSEHAQTDTAVFHEHHIGRYSDVSDVRATTRQAVYVFYHLVTKELQHAAVLSVGFVPICRLLLISQQGL